MNTHKICSHCKKDKPIEEFPRDRRYSPEGRKAYCKQCAASWRSPGGHYYQKHLDACKVYRDKNKEKKKLYNASYDSAGYQRERKKRDPLFKLRVLLSARMKEALKAKQWKKSTKFTDCLGCSAEQLKQHLERQFKPGMTWANHGEWEIHHIKPLAKAQNDTELYLRCHFSNLQPLWRHENREKRDRE
jgi:hypothetical protein